MEYKVAVEVYEGPLELLLSLIHKHEIDIYDIPINIITEQFLDYIDNMGELNLEVTSEFLVMAATLVEIKSKMLLPKEKIIEDGIEIEVDPRDELVQRLIEYKAYKGVAEKLKESESIESKVYYKPREDLTEFDDPIEELGNLDLEKLLKTINSLLKRRIKESNLIDVEELHREEFTLDGCIYNLKSKLAVKKRILFSDLLSVRTTREEIITYFLSVLELVKTKTICVDQNKSFSDLIIMKRMDEELYG
ncbi:segregation/condensation protein A [Tissierella sp. Yu-01]|uniref:segregation and condensation protein A n=1 Tax=Tissierella sp. Yu-01 TaxID=3035694 RepID=UPI00240E5D2F|nr:segregation/condensation protein A [Tissierella sp. Yu-01]WFA09709.1 segregation/condensation protein A [Tissierella sp. Yu-01]